MSVLLIQQAIEYIERHLYEKIDYTDVAKSVYMSAYNFHRTFGFLVGMSPNEYVKSRRLSLAAQALQSSEISVIDAAYRFGYETPESFSKAFSRFHGCSPVQAKRGGVKLRLFNPLAIKITFEGGSVMDYAIKRKQGQRFLAVKRAFPNEISTDDNDRSIPDFWTECQEGDVIGRMLRLRAEGKRDLYGLCRPVRANETHFDYGIGVLRMGNGRERLRSLSLYGRKRRLHRGNVEQVFSTVFSANGVRANGRYRLRSLLRTRGRGGVLRIVDPRRQTKIIAVSKKEGREDLPFFIW